MVNQIVMTTVELCRVNSEDMTLFMLSLIFYGNVLFSCVALDNRCILILIFKSVGGKSFM
jgi:hypothetical protein